VNKQETDRKPNRQTAEIPMLTT